MLVYQPDDAQQASFYPFATFSPEWQAIQYARAQKIHVRFMDLPAAHQFALDKEKAAGAGSETALDEEGQKASDSLSDINVPVEEEGPAVMLKKGPDQLPGGSSRLC
nr:DUF5682 family protein [Paraflavitalea speifideiaquila]